MTPSVERILKIQGALKVVVDTAADGTPVKFTVPISIDGERRILKWGTYMPGTALGAADTVELASKAFGNLPIKAEELRTLAERVRVGEVTMMHMDSAYAIVAKEHSSNKELLCKAVTIVADTLSANLDNPCTDADLREVLEAHGRPVLKMINQYNSSLSAKKDQIQRVRDEGAAALEEANAKFEAMNATADVMRGKNLTPENLQPRKLSR